MSIYEKTADNSTSQRATLYLPSVSTLYSRAQVTRFLYLCYVFIFCIQTTWRLRKSPSPSFKLSEPQYDQTGDLQLSKQNHLHKVYYLCYFDAEMTTSFDSDVSPDAIDTISVEHVTRVSSDGGHASDTSLGPASPGPGASGKKMSVASSLSTSSDKILFNMTSGGHFIMVTQGC